MALMSLGNKFSLYLGYPCSVDAGVNPVAYADMIINRVKKLHEEQRSEAAQILRDQLCRLSPGCSTDSSDAQLRENADKLKESWGYAVREDKTMMKSDMKLVAKCSKEMNFSAHSVNQSGPGGLNLRVIDEFQNERINDVKSFLSYIPVPQNNTIRFLCLCGHGLSEEDAAKLNNNPAKGNRSPVWPWELCSCKEAMEQDSYVMTRNAEVGDIVVFSSGLLTLEWVIDRLRICEEDLRSRILKGKKPRDREEELRKVQNTIYIVIDACYSGMWKTRMQKCLTTDRPLEFTRVILQTSCGEGEVSYGCCFMPVFCALQNAETRAKVLKAYTGNSHALQNEMDRYIDDIEMYDYTPQTPTVYDSKDAENNNILPFYLVNDANFLTFCLKYLTISSLQNVRGIPDDQLRSFFRSFGSGSCPEIHCFKLKRHSSGTPLALFLMKWNKKFYHIHLHFNDFDNMRLTGVNHFNVTKEYSNYGYWYKYKEEDYSRVPINYKRGNAKWDLVERNGENMIAHCRAFVEQHNRNWNNKEHWCMQHAMPRLIRSRSAYFQDTKAVHTKKAKFKALYEANA